MCAGLFFGIQEKVFSYLLSPVPTKTKEFKLIEKAQTGDETAIELLINSYIPRVEELLKSISHEQSDFVHLIDAGQQGIIKAVKLYSQKSKYSFEAYVSFWIKKSFQEYLDDQTYYSFDDFAEEQKFFVQEANRNKIFIYPTDTVYGIGMVYTPENLTKINLIKQRDPDKMCSIIAPSYDWIKKEYASVIDPRKFSRSILEKYLSTYHGITLIFSHELPGVRIIKHPFQKFVSKVGKAFISTSVNLAGQENIQEITEVPGEIRSKVHYIINDSKLDGKPSVLIDLIEDKIIVR